MLPVLGKKAVLEWCMKEGLIGSSYVCPKCEKSMELRERTGVDALAVRLQEVAEKPNSNSARKREGNAPAKSRRRTVGSFPNLVLGKSKNEIA
ncbi:hypothetical protein TNCV_3956381 [Trichonephila clavipes]|nr:hypothetical protein TNCV_3956381 [Trichonephila clavipes]